MTSDVQPLPEKRLPGAWIALLLLFSFLIFSAVSSALTPKSKEQNTYGQEQTALRMTLACGKAFSGLAGSNSLTQPLEDIVAKATPEVKTNPNAAHLVAAVDTELKKPVSKEVLQALASTKTPESVAFKTIYGSAKLSAVAATGAISKLSDDTFIERLAKVQAREKAGIEPTHRDDVIPVWKAYVLVVGVLGFGLVFAGCIGVWIAFFALRGTGRLETILPPADKMPGIQADRLAWRAFQLIASFYVLSFVAQFLAAMHLGLPPMALNLLPSVGVLVLIFVYAKIPIGGERLQLRDIGLHTDNFGRNVLWGFAGFLAEFPITLSLLAVGRILFSFFPEPTHPAGEALMNNPSIVTIVTVLVLGALIAPFWEETAFRGMLFPAFGKVFGRYLPAALLSSFLFAAIHPQGPVLWFSLASVAMVSCLLVTRTKSLVPSITMHFIHNSLLLLFGVLIS